MLTIIAITTNNFFTLTWENNAKLIPKIIFEVNDARVRIDMFRSFKNSLRFGETENGKKDKLNFKLEYAKTKSVNL